MSSRPPETHPLVISYLDELRRLLSGIDDAERLEVVEGVREHIDSSLEDTAATEADVRAALDEVGPAQAVADEAYAGRHQSVVPIARPSVTSRVWLPVTTAVLEGIAVLVVLLVVGSSVGSTGTSTSTSSVGIVGQDGVTPVAQAAETVSETRFDGSVAGAFGGFFGSLPFWLVVVILVGSSALWFGREKLALMAVVPACAFAFGALPEIGNAVSGVDGAVVGAWIGVALSVLGGGAVVGVLVRRACRRAGALASA